VSVINPLAQNRADSGEGVAAFALLNNESQIS